MGMNRASGTRRRVIGLVGGCAAICAGYYTEIDKAGILMGGGEGKE